MTGDPPNTQFNDPKIALDKVCSWLSDLGISIEKNRLSTYRKAFQIIAAKRKAGTVQEIGAERSVVEAANAFHEFGEIFQVWRGLRSIDGPIMRQKLAKVVEGPHRLSDERPKSTEPGNTLFELVIASYLSLCGIKIQFRDPDDVVARVLHTPLLIECKRIQSEARFEERLHEAERQLVRNLRNEVAGSKGLIAIDISKTQNPSGSYFRAESPAQIRGILLQKINHFCWDRIKLFQEGIDESVIAAIRLLKNSVDRRFQLGGRAQFAIRPVGEVKQKCRAEYANLRRIKSISDSLGSEWAAMVTTSTSWSFVRKRSGPMLMVWGYPWLTNSLPPVGRSTGSTAEAQVLTRDTKT
jgi:hypothetical protein